VIQRSYVAGGQVIKLPRLRISIRGLMIFIASIALFVGGGRRLIVGDGGVTVELVNGLGRPLKDVRLACNGESVVANELAPGGVIRGRLWPAEIRPDGSMDGRFLVSYELDGRLCQTRPFHTFYLLADEPNVRWIVANAHEPEAYCITSTEDPQISSLRRLLRRLWFRGTWHGS
jgi:hypothetical protein